MEKKFIPEIYISYAWEKQTDGSNWPIILKNLYKTLIEKGYKVHVDVNSVKYKDNIKSFMKDLGKGKYIISIISEKYMKSINCMYEVLQMLKYPNFQDRIFPILSSDAKIYDSSKILEYLIYWDEKIITLNNEAKGLSNIAYAGPIFEDIEIMNDIRRVLAQFGNEIGDMNVLTPEIHNESNFKELIEGIENKVEIDKNTIDLKIENLSLKEENLNLKNELENLRQELLKLQTKQIEEEKAILIENLILEDNNEINYSNEHSILDFEKFIGLSKDSTLKDAIKLYGQPIIRENENKYGFNDATFNDHLSLSYYKSSEKIMVITLTGYKNSLSSVTEYIKSKGIIDPKIDFLGTHKDEILSAFGTPDMEHADNYYYRYTSEKLSFSVNFVCYSFNDFLCNEINIQFFRNE